MIEKIDLVILTIKVWLAGKFLPPILHAVRKNRLVSYLIRLLHLNW